MRRLALLALLCAPTAWAAQGGGVAGSKHDFSITGKGAVKARSEQRACIFCHAAHAGGQGASNRPAGLAAPQAYRSATMASQPSSGANGASRLCLSCHDGTMGIGETLTARIDLSGPASARAGGQTAGAGMDLTRGHPVSFRVAASAAVRRPEKGEDVQLDPQAQVQCTSCHDPHREAADPVERMFLVKPTRSGQLCLGCHTMPGWQSGAAAHQASTASTQVAGSTARYPTVAENGCGSCHVSHRAGAASLLKVAPGQGEDQVCLACHDGRVARTNLAAEVSKPYAHAMPLGPTGHVAGEGPQNAADRLPENRATAPRHVACVDCHEPHAATSRPAQAPRAGGALTDVWGIDRNGVKVARVSYEYEVCFKCHADSANQPQQRAGALPGTPQRAVVDVNLRRVFGADATSSHPVLGPGRGSSVPSLIAPLTAASTIYCSDCHASDARAASASAPRGPHGSVYPHLLERSYLTADRSPESAGSYALCYKCHDRSVLVVNLAPGSPAAPLTAFAAPTSLDPRKQNLHRLHVADPAVSTPCSTCHNAHGVSARAAGAAGGAHLVDFDVAVVKPSARGQRAYTSRGLRSGSCALSCHGKDHDDLGY